jgi:vanillate O-demethylase ferredoxin subunit
MYRPLRVSSIVQETDEINIYELVDAQGLDLPPFSAGAHIEIGLPGNRVRHYSICNDPFERYRYVVAVKRAMQGRGGSRFMHEQVGVGTVFPEWTLRNTFELDETANHSIFIAGGIGITPVLPMMATLKRLGRPFTLHYCAKSEARAAFRGFLQEEMPEECVVFHYSAQAAGRWQVADAIAAAPPGAQLYCCGPAALIAAVRDATASWPAGAVHYEFFSADASLSPLTDGEFSVKIKDGDVYTVPPDKTILRVLREHGVHVESSCEAGACGTCCVRYIDGTPDHRDMYLTDSEKKEFIMVCVSRSRSPCLTLDL